MLKIRDPKALRWFTEMTKQITWDLVDDKPRLAQGSRGPQL